MSSVFKRKFELAKTQVKDMMASIQLCMKAVQLRISQSAGTGAPSGLTKQDIEAAIGSATKHEQTSSAINVAVDAKLDAIIEQQHEMLDFEQKQLKAQDETTVKVDAPMTMVSDANDGAMCQKFNAFL